LAILFHLLSKALSARNFFFKVYYAQKSPAMPSVKRQESELWVSTLSRATSGEKGGLGGFKGQHFARSRYGPHHGSGLPTRLFRSVIAFA
jgi:hypothetical protein